MERNLRAAYRLATECAAIYAAAKPAERRLINQAFFSAIYVDTDPPGDAVSIARGELTAPFDRLLDPGLRDRLRAGTKNRDPHFTGHGLRETEMVEVTGLEPVTSTLRT